MFIGYKFKCWKKEIRTLLTERLKIKDRIRYHLKKIEYHKEKIKIIEEKELPKIEEELNEILIKAGNKI